jgi:hypothetical protein
MGHFSEGALDKYNQLCAEKRGVDFAEGDSYDFARCVMPDGEVYGTKGQCKVGKPISGKEETAKEGNTGGQMAKLKRAFIKKMGRDMTPAELKKAENMIASIGVPIPAGESAESFLQKLLPKGAKVVPVKTA